MLRSFAVRQQAQTSFKGRLKRQLELAQPLFPPGAEAGLNVQVTWCVCVHRKSAGKVVRGLRLRSSRQSVSAQTCPAEDGGMEPPQDMAKVSNTEDNHNRRIHSLYAAPLFQRISQTNLENRQAKGLEFSSTAWNVQGRDKTPNLSKVESKEGPGYRLLNVSGGSGGWSLSPDPVEDQAGPRAQCASGREGNLPSFRELYHFMGNRWGNSGNSG